MKPVLIVTDCAGMHGAEQINHSLAIALSRAGYRVSFAQPAADHEFIRAREAQGIVHYWLPPEALYDLGSPAPSLTEAGPAKIICERVRPALVIFADGCPLSNLAAKTWCANQGVPFLVLVHCVFEGWSRDYACYLAELAKSYSAAQEVIAVSSENLQLLRHRFGLGGDKGRVIYNGRPASYFSAPDAAERLQLREKLGLSPDSILCLSIGRMELAKGFQYQLDALRRLSDSPCWSALHFLWVGSGTRQQRLVGLAKMVAGGRVTHFEQRDDIPLLMAAADMLLHCARYEGMPLVVLESMARALPVIATGVSGIPEALGDTGLLLTPPDEATDLPGEIAEAVSTLAQDDNMRRHLGQAAQRRALTLFREDDMLQRYMDLVAQLMVSTT